MNKIAVRPKNVTNQILLITYFLFFSLVWLITAELYPTDLRSQALGLCSTTARIFGLVCPFVATLAIYWKPLPMLVLGLPSLIAGSMAFFIPETKGKVLPQTMKDTQISNEFEL